MADWIIREIRAFGTGEKEKGEEEEEALQLATTISVEHFESTDTGMCRYVCRFNFSVVCILGKMFFAAECNKWRALVLIRSRQEALIRQRKSGLRMVPLVRVQICQWLVAIE